MSKERIASQEEWAIVFGQFRRGELKDCLPRLERIRFLASTNKERRRALVYLVRANIALSNPRMAMLYALEAAKLIDDALGNFTLSLAYGASGDIDNAIHHLRKNIEQSPFEPTWHFQLAELLSNRQRRYEEALSEYRWATKLEGSRFRFWLPVVECLLNLKRFDEALRCVDDMQRRQWKRRVVVMSPSLMSVASLASGPAPAPRADDCETEEVVDDFATHSLLLLKAKVLRACGKVAAAEQILESMYEDDLQGGLCSDDEEEEEEMADGREESRREEEVFVEDANAE